MTRRNQAVKLLHPVKEHAEGKGEERGEVDGCWIMSPYLVEHMESTSQGLNVESSGRDRRTEVGMVEWTRTTETEKERGERERKKERKMRERKRDRGERKIEKGREVEIEGGKWVREGRSEKNELREEQMKEQEGEKDRERKTERERERTKKRH